MKHPFKTSAGLAAFAITSVLAASCTKEVHFFDELHEELVTEPVTISANAGLPTANSTDKAYFNNLTVKWNAADALNINGTSLTINDIRDNGTKGVFYGSTNAISSGSNHVYWAVYPATLADAPGGSSVPTNYFSTSSVTIDIPDVQHYYSNQDTLKGNTYMVGYTSVPSGSSTLQFQMRNIGSVLRLHLKSASGVTGAAARATKIEFTSAGNLAGKFTVSNNSTNPTVTGVSGHTSHALTVKLHDGTNDYIDISGGVTICVILPPISSQTIHLTIYNANGKLATKRLTKTLERNHCYNGEYTDIPFNELPYYSVGTDGQYHDNEQVMFAPGNLQWRGYNGSTKLEHTGRKWGQNGQHPTETRDGQWRFATKQWRTAGDAANQSIAETCTAWIDLFGWGTGGWHSGNDNGNVYYQPWSTNNSEITNGYSHLNYYGYGPSKRQVWPLGGGSSGYDWAWANQIVNGNTTDGFIWWTLEIEHWNYILRTRATGSVANNVANARWTITQLDTLSSHDKSYNATNAVLGMLLFPDNGGIFNMEGTGSFGSVNVNGTSTTLSHYDWLEWEKKGAVFLPVAGYRTGQTIQQSAQGHYWSTSACDTIDKDPTVKQAKRIWFQDGKLGDGTNSDRSHGNSIRPVKKYTD